MNLPEREADEPGATELQIQILEQLGVHRDAASSLGVDQASILIREVAAAAVEKRAIATVRRAARSPAI